MRLFLEGNHFCRLSPRDASYQRPLQKVVQGACHQDEIAVLWGRRSSYSVAKYAISLKQWESGGGGRNAL